MFLSLYYAMSELFSKYIWIEMTHGGSLRGTVGRRMN